MWQFALQSRPIDRKGAVLLRGELTVGVSCQRVLPPQLHGWRLRFASQ